MDRIVDIPNRINRMTHFDRRNGGFSLVETLVALMIVLLVSAVAATGIPSAVHAYEKARNSANAQVVLTGTLSALRNELALATDYHEAGTEDSACVDRVAVHGYWVGFASSKKSDGTENTISWDENGTARNADLRGNGIQELYYATEVDSVVHAVMPLLPASSVPDDLYVVMNSEQPITYSNGVFTIKDLVVKDKEGNVLAKIDDNGVDEYKVKSIVLKAS